MSDVRKFQADAARRGLDGFQMMDEAHLRLALVAVQREVSRAVADDPSCYEERLAAALGHRSDALFTIDKALAKRWRAWTRQLGPSDFLTPPALEIWRRHAWKARPTTVDPETLRAAFGRR